MESLIDAWRHAQKVPVAPFTVVLQAGQASDGYDSNVSVDDMFLWHQCPLLRDMAGCAKGPVKLEGVSAAVLHAVVETWYDPSAPTWPTDMLPEIFTFAHKFGMQHVQDAVMTAVVAGPIALDVLQDLYLRALPCKKTRRAALVKLCAGRPARTVVNTLGIGLLVEDAHLVVEHAKGTVFTTLSMLRRIAKQNADTTTLVWEPICSSIVEVVKKDLCFRYYQQKRQSLNFMISTGAGETMLAQHSLDLAVAPLVNAALEAAQRELYSLKWPHPAAA